MDIGIERAIIKRKHQPRKWLKTLIWIIFIILIVLFAIILRVQTKYHDKIVVEPDWPSPKVALVFGAGLRTQTRPGAVLEDRILTAIKLYQSGAVGRFIMSGDVRSGEQNEVDAMKAYALAQGLPEEALILDPGGQSTLDSCWRVKSEFGLNKVILITQKYHLRRALYICNELHIEAIGVAAENRGYRRQFQYTLREWPASLKAWWDVRF